MESTTRRIVMALCHVIAEADEWEDIAVASRALAKFVEAERLETEYHLRAMEAAMNLDAEESE